MTNRLADEATYFGAVADGAASRDDEVAELRQQLADVKTVSDHNLKVYQEAAEKLRQQLAEREKQVTLLREALEGLVAWANDLRRSDPVEDLRKAREALAVTKEN